MRNTAMIAETMQIVAAASSHFDPSVSGKVQYSEEPLRYYTVHDFWHNALTKNDYCLTEKGEHSRYGLDARFSPEWLDHLSVEDHERIAIFIRNHKDSFWAIDGMVSALAHECLSSNPRFAFLLRNFILLWDNTTSHVLSKETEDCYSLHAISGISGVDISALPGNEQDRYGALAAFAVDAYLSDFYGQGHAPHPSGRPFAVDEIVYPGHYEVQEPYLSMVMKYPEQGSSMIRYMSLGYTGDELETLLADCTPATMSVGIL